MKTRRAVSSPVRCLRAATGAASLRLQTWDELAVYIIGADEIRPLGLAIKSVRRSAAREDCGDDVSPFGIVDESKLRNHWAHLQYR
jgi:ribose 5-phosphate isomerase